MIKVMVLPYFFALRIKSGDEMWKITAKIVENCK